eukprot:403369633
MNESMMKEDFERSGQLSMNIREISIYNLEVLKDRLKDFSNVILERHDQNVQEVSSKQGLHQLGILFEHETQEQFDTALQSDLIKLKQNLQDENQAMKHTELIPNLIKLQDLREECKQLLQERLNTQEGDQLKSMFDWLSQSQQRNQHQFTDGKSVNLNTLQQQYFQNLEAKSRDQIKQVMDERVSIVDRYTSIFQEYE